MKAFQIKVNGKLLDYRLGQVINLEKFSRHLESKGYRVEKLWQEKRHVVGIVEISNKKLFVKLATSEGINATTKNESLWNEKFNTVNPRVNSIYWVPRNIDSGEFENLFYLITDFLDSEKLTERPNPGYKSPDFNKYLERLIDFTELIQALKIENLEPDEQFKNLNHHERFLIKAKMWLKAVPDNVAKKYKVNELFKIVEFGYKDLSKKSRHGDFTPWHILKLENKKLLLIDGEHAISNGAQYYDIAYLIQRIFSVMENKELAQELLVKLKKRNYDFGKLKTVLASRAIGGFLDKSFHKKPNYEIDFEFKKLVLEL